MCLFSPVCGLPPLRWCPVVCCGAHCNISFPFEGNPEVPVYPPLPLTDPAAPHPHRGPHILTRPPSTRPSLSSSTASSWRLPLARVFNSEGSPFAVFSFRFLIFLFPPPLICFGVFSIFDLIRFSGLNLNFVIILRTYSRGFCACICLRAHLCLVLRSRSPSALPDNRYTGLQLLFRNSPRLHGYAYLYRDDLKLCSLIFLRISFTDCDSCVSWGPLRPRTSRWIIRMCRPIISRGMPAAGAPR